jgi:thioredoxin:protein disulfide reductase
MKIILMIVAAVMFSPLNAYLLSAKQVVSVRALAPADSLRAGSPSILTVELSIASPYHINSDRPLENYLIPTALEFEPQAGVTFGKAIFPKAPLKKLMVSDSPMAVFEGIVKVTAEIIPSSNLAEKEITIRGRVRYQACDDRVCLPPASELFSLTLPVELRDPSQIETSSSLSEKPGEKPGTTTTVAFEQKGLLATFLLVFLGGLALNLTPCVYPMIPITITYFGGQAQGKKGSLIIHSLLYVIGMAITYSVLGVAAAMTGGLFGAALQYPPVLIGIALVMGLLALSMFDVYELRMPAFLNRLAGHSQKGFAGTLLMGLTVGIVAAPCIGPFVLGLLTYVGNKGSIILGFALFFTLALGLGVPFLVLGVFSGSISRLPRSGAWMVWVRKIFGFILLTMALYFLKSILPGGLLTYYIALALILLLAGIYMAWIEPTSATGRFFPVVRNLVGIIFFAVALYAAITGIQTSIGSFAIPSIRQNPGGTIQWSSYSEAMLAQASREAKPVFIDFYADWCAPCKELDVQTFSTPEVVAQSRRFIMLKVDLTSSDNPQAEALRQKYQAKGVPTLVFLRPDGREISELRATGFEPKESFLDKMNRALQISAVQEQPR